MITASEAGKISVEAARVRRLAVTAKYEDLVSKVVTGAADQGYQRAKIRVFDEGDTDALCDVLRQYGYVVAFKDAYYIHFEWGV